MFLEFWNNLQNICETRLTKLFFFFEVTLKKIIMKYYAGLSENLISE